MKTSRLFQLVLVPVVIAACGGDGATSDPPTRDAVEVATAPSAGDVEFAELTANWSQVVLDGCGRTLREALGTRDLVQGAFDSVKDPRGVAATEIEDARHWIELGNSHIAGVRPRLANGECDGSITLALDEAVQAYVKAGTAAVQAGQIAGS
jgi:hypothetical protein